jgi:hypothetical protein
LCHRRNKKLVRFGHWSPGALAELFQPKRSKGATSPWNILADDAAERASATRMGLPAAPSKDRAAEP